MIDIKGQLTVGPKGELWFNDSNGRCLLRIYGINPKQVLNIETRMVDIYFNSYKNHVSGYRTEQEWRMNQMNKEYPKTRVYMTRWSDADKSWGKLRDVTLNEDMWDLQPPFGYFEADNPDEAQKRREELPPAKAVRPVDYYPKWFQFGEYTPTIKSISEVKSEEEE